MNAAEIADALGGRQRPYATSRGIQYRIHCPNPDHPDVHASCDMLDTGDRLLFTCRSRNCSWPEMKRGLEQRGLWEPSRSPERASLRDRLHIRRDLPAAPDCCLEGQCAHWDEFDRLFLLSEFRKNLLEAGHEIAHKLERAGRPITADALRKGIEFAIPFGAIVPSEITDDRIVAKAIDLVVTEFDAEMEAA